MARWISLGECKLATERAAETAVERDGVGVGVVVGREKFCRLAVLPLGWLVKLAWMGVGDGVLEVGWLRTLATASGGRAAESSLERESSRFLAEFEFAVAVALEVALEVVLEIKVDDDFGCGFEFDAPGVLAGGARGEKLPGARNGGLAGCICVECVSVTSRPPRSCSSPAAGAC